jgi:5-methylcytosine-specific restriction endonuclease McrA
LAEPALPIQIKDEHKVLVKKAINSFTEGVKEIPYKIVRSIDGCIIVPMVIRLVKLVRNAFKAKVPFNKANIFIRDNYTCQYCEKKVNMKTGDLEHILPKSRGGKDTWENCVCSCRKCNNKKDDMTPREAGMRLLRNKYDQPTVQEWLYKGLTESGVVPILKSLGLS